MSGLGRREPSDWGHVDRYPLSAIAAPENVPVIFGTNWWTNFDNPKLDGGRHWIGRGDLGTIRGGHCVCLKPWDSTVTDPVTWWDFYNQGREGSCVGFGSSRAMSLLNRKRYDAHWLYEEAQLVDEYSDTPPAEGTSVRAGCWVLRKQGHRVVRAGKDSPPSKSEGISAYRWASTWDEVRGVLGVPDSLGGVPLLNSWGRAYAHTVYLADEAGAQVLAEAGEAAILTDR